MYMEGKRNKKGKRNAYGTKKKTTTTKKTHKKKHYAATVLDLVYIYRFATCVFKL